LVELIVLNIGYDAHIIDSRIFLIMTIVALVTTFMTSPIISVLYPAKYHAVSGLWPQHIVEHLSMRRSVRSTTMDFRDQQQQNSPKGQVVEASAYQDHVRLLIYLDDQNPLPTVAKFLSYLVASGGHRKIDKSLSLSALKVVEPTERSSSVILAHNIDEIVKSDQSMVMVRLLAGIFSLPIRCLAAVSRREEVGDEVNYVTLAEDCDFVLVGIPYHSEPSFNGHVIRNIENSVHDRSLAIFCPSEINLDELDSVDDRGFMAILDGSQESYDIARFLAKIARNSTSSTTTGALKILFLDQSGKKVERNPSKSTTVSQSRMQKENFGAQLDLPTTEEEILVSSDESRLKLHLELLIGLQWQDFQSIIDWKLVKPGENAWSAIASELSLSKFELLFLPKHLQLPESNFDTVAGGIELQELNKSSTLIRQADTTLIEEDTNANLTTTNVRQQNEPISQNPLVITSANVDESIINNINIDNQNRGRSLKSTARQISQLSKMSLKSLKKSSANNNARVENEAEVALGGVAWKLLKMQPSLSILVVSRPTLATSLVRDEKF